MARILVFGNANRTDYVEQFKVPAQEHDIIWIHFTDKKPSQKELFGIRILWIIKFWNIQQIFNKFKPDHTVFFHLASDIDALGILEAKSRNIKTWFIDHGISFLIPDGHYKRIKSNKPNINLIEIKRVKKHHQLLNRGLLKLFFYGSYLRINYRKQLKNYLFVKKENGITKKIFKHLRKYGSAKYFLPDSFISYSQHNWKCFYNNYRLEEKEKPNVKFIGIPNYDKYYTTEKSKNKNENDVILIDQPMYVTGIISKKEYINLNNNIIQWWTNQGYRVFFKKHPKTSQDIVDSITSNFQQINEINHFNYKFCLGYSSTLLLLFILKKCKVISYDFDFVKEINFYKNYDLVESRSIDQIETHKLPDDKPLDLNNIEEIIYKWDGKSGGRLSNLFK